jgi:hypothetical protein
VRAMAQHRCTECRTWFAPAVTARAHQRVCGTGCKRRRRNKLARRRRRDDLEAQRADERLRQEKHREGREGEDCHEPPSGRKCAELLVKLEQIVDKATRLSRATFRRDALRILRRSTVFSSAAMDGAGRCHEPPSALGAAESGSRSAAGVDGVTARDGL